MMLHCIVENKIAVSWKSLEFKVEAVVRKRQKVLAQLVKNPPAMQEDLLGDRLPTPVLLGFPCGSAGKESACNVGDLGWIPGLGRSPGERKGSLLQYSGLENSCLVWGCKQSNRLSNFHFHFLFLSQLLPFPWRRKWLPTPVFLLGKSHEQRSLADYGPWGHKESDTTEHAKKKGGP